MCPTCGNGGMYHNPTVRHILIEYSKPHWIDTRFKYNDYPYPPSAQTLRPPTVNSGYPSNDYYMDRTSSHSSSDQGYCTRTPSVASPTPQPSYPTQSSPVEKSSFQNYSTQSYFPSQQSPTYTYNAPRNPGIEVVQTAPVSTSKHEKKRRLRYDTVPICLCNPAKQHWIAFHVFR